MNPISPILPIVNPQIDSWALVFQPIHFSELSFGHVLSNPHLSYRLYGTIVDGIKLHFLQMTHYQYGSQLLLLL